MICSILNVFSLFQLGGPEAERPERREIVMAAGSVRGRLMTWPYHQVPVTATDHFFRLQVPSTVH